MALRITNMGIIITLFPRKILASCCLLPQNIDNSISGNIDSPEKNGNKLSPESLLLANLKDANAFEIIETPPSFVINVYSNRLTNEDGPLIKQFFDYFNFIQGPETNTNPRAEESLRQKYNGDKGAIFSVMQLQEIIKETECGSVAININNFKEFMDTIKKAVVENLAIIIPEATNP